LTLLDLHLRVLPGGFNFSPMMFVMLASFIIFLMVAFYFPVAAAARFVAFSVGNIKFPLGFS
jgi:hypothetical protein